MLLKWSDIRELNAQKWQDCCHSQLLPCGPSGLPNSSQFFRDSSSVKLVWRREIQLTQKWKQNPQSLTCSSFNTWCLSLSFRDGFGKLNSFCYCLYGLWHKTVLLCSSLRHRQILLVLWHQMKSEGAFLVHEVEQSLSPSPQSEEKCSLLSISKEHISMAGYSAANLGRQKGWKQNIQDELI